MYRYYENSRICYAYLADVPTAKTAFEKAWDGSVPWLDGSQFERSKWFTRGWTLQELIAPRVVEFYAADWTEIGTKASMIEQLARRTGINPRVLNGADVSICNVAARLSWASTRQTTKIEDQAYCLLGLFRVNMPLIYGEGDNAFRRLQETILREVEDYTLLAWDLWLPDSNDFSMTMDVVCQRYSESRIHVPVPTLSTSLRGFSPNGLLLWSYSDVRQHMFTTDFTNALTRGGQSNHGPPEPTSRGLRVWLALRECSETISLAYINCRIRDRLICIPLKRATDKEDNIYSRVTMESLSGRNLLPYCQENPQHVLSGRIDYFFLDPEDLHAFRLRQIYLQPHRRDNSKPVRTPIISVMDYYFIVVIEGSDIHGTMECDDSNNRLIPITVRRKFAFGGFNPRENIIYCVYREQTPFIVVLGRWHCEIMMGCVEPGIQLYKDGRWDMSAIGLARTKHGETERAFEYRGISNELSPTDRISRTFEDAGLIVRVAYKRRARGTAVIISAVPLSRS